MSQQSDHELVRAVAAGDKATFAELVRRYEPVARAAAVAILRDTHLAQDVLQETFLRAYMNLGQLTDRSRFGPWVLKIARRQALHIRGRRQHVDSVLDLNDIPAEEERNGRLDEDSRDLLDAVQRLPDREQVAIVLHYFKAQKAETIARMTGCTTSTVTKNLSTYLR